METAYLHFPVTFDPAVTDAESLASAADSLLETALSAVGPLDEYGNPRFGKFIAASQPTGGPVKYLLYDFDADELATTNVYDSRAEAAEDADMLDNVIVVSVPCEILGGIPAGEPGECEEEV